MEYEIIHSHGYDHKSKIFAGWYVERKGGHLTIRLVNEDVVIHINMASAYVATSQWTKHHPCMKINGDGIEFHDGGGIIVKLKDGYIDGNGELTPEGIQQAIYRYRIEKL